MPIGGIGVEDITSCDGWEQIAPISLLQGNSSGDTELVPGSLPIGRSTLVLEFEANASSLERCAAILSQLFELNRTLSPLVSQGESSNAGFEIDRFEAQPAPTLCVSAPDAVGGAGRTLSAISVLLRSESPALIALGEALTRSGVDSSGASEIDLQRLESLVESLRVDLAKSELEAAEQ